MREKLIFGKQVEMTLAVGDEIITQDQARKTREVLPLDVVVFPSKNNLLRRRVNRVRVSHSFSFRFINKLDFIPSG